jgi:hypothetical protein
MQTTPPPVPVSGSESADLNQNAIALVAAPVTAFIILVIAGYGGIKMTSLLAADVVEEMSESMNFREFVVDTLANVGIVSALILSIVISMMQVEKPDGLPLSYAISWEVYVSVCFLAAGFSVQGVVTSAFGI